MLNISKVAYSELESLTPFPLPPPGDKRPGDFKFDFSPKASCFRIRYLLKVAIIRTLKSADNTMLFNLDCRHFTKVSLRKGEMRNGRVVDTGLVARR